MKFMVLMLLALISTSALAFDAKQFHISYFQETESKSLEMGNDKNSISTFRQASFRYKLTDVWTMRVDLRDETTGQIQDGSGDAHDRLDPRIGIQGVVWKSGKYSLFTQFLADVKANLHKQGSDKIIRPRIYNAVNIELSDTQSLAVSLAFRRWIYQPGKDYQDDLQMDGFTEITYRLKLDDMMTFQAYYFAALKSRKDHTAADYRHSTADLDLGLEFAFKDVGTFMPYIGYDLQTYVKDDDENILRETHDTEYSDLSIGFWLATRFY